MLSGAVTAAEDRSLYGRGSDEWHALSGVEIRCWPVTACLRAWRIGGLSQGGGDSVGGWDAFRTLATNPMLAAPELVLR
ncbi:MAG TPA: hypothetical protein VGH38_12490 [Bryobacteraceae bacterium]